MSKKRFYIDNNGDLYDRKTNSLLMLDFGMNSANECNSILNILNNLHDDNLRLQKCINEIFLIAKEENVDYK